MNEDLAVIISYSVEKNVGKILSGEIDESGINFEDARLAMDARSEEFTRREAEIKSGALPPYFDAWCKATVDVVMRILKQKVAKIK
jgi:hypothetical protein